MSGSELSQASNHGPLWKLSQTMARSPRTRSRAIPYTGETQFHTTPDFSGSFGSTVTTKVRNSTCSDRTGSPVVDSPFTSSQKTGMLFLNGDVVTSSPHRGVRFLAVPSIGSSSIPSASDLTPVAAPNGWVLSLIAMTNPSRPVINPPEMIQNFKELPKLLLDTWKFFLHPKTVLTPRGAANAHLGVRFGWLPFIDDMQKLLDIQSHVLKRTQELHRLYSGQGMRARRSFGKSTKVVEQSEEFPLQGVGNSVRVKISCTIQYTSWGTIRWKPTSPPPYHPDDMRSHNLVRKVVLGLTPEGLANGIWKVIPWTWLIGWFTNVGSLTLLSSNTVPATWSRCNFMSMMHCTYQPGLITPVGSIKSFDLTYMGNATTVVRTRIQGTAAFPGVNMPFLDMSRLSVLASLVAQRFKLVGFRVTRG